MSTQHRAYQHAGLAELRVRWRAGSRSILLVGPTGMGKTHLATMIGEGLIRKGKRVGFFVHRKELEAQAARAFTRLDVRAGIVRADSPPTTKQFQIVSIQTAAKRDLALDYDFVFLDEAHHFASKKWCAPILSMRARGVGIVGLTATPDRGDGKGLGEIFDDMLTVAQPQELIRSGYLVPCRVIGPMRARKSLARHPVQAYLQYARGRRTITFCGTVSYARKLTAEFVAAGVNAKCIDGKMPTDARADAIFHFCNGAVEVLVSVGVLTEGFDAPATSCIILTASASSPAALIQKCGRGMRPAPGKKDCLILDLKASCRELAMLPDDDRTYSLTGRAISTTTPERGDSIAQCRNCGLWFHSNEFKRSACPECGFVRQGGEDPRIRNARMAAISATMTTSQRLSFLVQAIIEGRSKRKKNGEPYKAVGWAMQAFTRKFTSPPTKVDVQTAIQLADKRQSR